MSRSVEAAVVVLHSSKTTSHVGTRVVRIIDLNARARRTIAGRFEIETVYLYREFFR